MSFRVVAPAGKQPPTSFDCHQYRGTGNIMILFG